VFPAGLQPKLSDQLHGVLRRLHQRPDRGADAEDVRAVRSHPGHPSLQGQRLRLHQIRNQRVGDARHRDGPQHRDKRPHGEVLLGQGERRNGGRSGGDDVGSGGGARDSGATLPVRLRRLLVPGLRGIHAGVPVPTVPVPAAVLHDAAARTVDRSTRTTAERAGDVQHGTEVPLSVKTKDYRENIILKKKYKLNVQ
jgi:hypothetical protein